MGHRPDYIGHGKTLMLITRDEIEPMLDKYKVFVPKKRRYYIESLYSHYAHTHDETHFQIVEKIISSDCPEYLVQHCQNNNE